MPDTFDFTTSDILDWELNLIQNALDRQQIEITDHAFEAAQEDNIPPVALLETILIGVAVSKDLPDNQLQRVPGINFEHCIKDGRWIRVKVAWINNYAIITVYKI